MPTDKLTFVLIETGLLEDFSPRARVEVDFLHCAVLWHWDNIEGNLFSTMGVSVDDVPDAIALQGCFIVGISPVVVGSAIGVLNDFVPEDLSQPREREGGTRRAT